MSRYCVNCGTELPDEAGFCPKCGTKIEVPCCPACGKEVDFDTDFCIYCGQPLKEAKSESAFSPPGGQAVKAPDVADTSHADEIVMSESMPQEFSWSYKAALGRLETTVNTVTVQIANDVIRIHETQGSARGNKEPNQLPEKEIPLSGIESVRVCSHWSILFGIPLLLCVPLLLYGWLASRIDLMTAVLCLAVVTVAAFRYSFQIHHHRLIITDHDKNRIALNGKDKFVLRQVEDAIISCTGLTPHNQGKKRPALKIIGIVLALFVLVFAAICAFEEIYLRRILPKQIMSNPDVIAYAQTEINYHLAPDNYEITVEITGGDLTKRTVMPKYENSIVTYLFVDYVYDITVSSGTESINGTVTVDASFEANPFSSKPNDILLNTFTYSDNLKDYVESLKAHTDAIISENLIGCWEFEYVEYNTGETASREDGILSYFRFYPDNSYLYTGTSTSDIVSSGRWQTFDEEIVLSDDYDNDERVITLDGSTLYLKKVDKIVCYSKVSELPDYASSSDTITGYFDRFIGDWYSEEAFTNLFIGYGNDAGQTANGILYTASEEYNGIELWTDDGQTIQGLLMGYGSEPILSLSLTYDGYGFWGSIHYGETGEEEVVYLIPYEGHS